jgi:hypothetical protein
MTLTTTTLKHRHYNTKTLQHKDITIQRHYNTKTLQHKDIRMQ